jgi:shikimate dehydrogenase
LALIGHPVAHSLSPVFQNAALEAAGIGLVYEALDVVPDALTSLLTSLRGSAAAGNVTIPHKRGVFARCDLRTPLAERVGAVNTFWHSENGALVGDNTDVAGFERAVDELGVERRGATVVCVGAGGSAAAICAAVADWLDAHFVLVARRHAQAQDLIARVGAPLATVARDSGVAKEASLVVNATPLGLADDAHPIPMAQLARDARVMDLVYRAGSTAWVRAARRAGHAAVDGREMLLHQGALSFERWLGVTPNLSVMRQALEKALER